MKNKLHLLSAAAALATSALVGHAQYVSGDIVVGFKATSATNDLMIDVGSVSSLMADTSTTLIGNYATSLTNFLSTWATSGATQWSAAGEDNNNSIAYVTAKWSTNYAGALAAPGGSTVPTGGSSSAIGAGSSNIVLMGQGFNGPTASAAADSGAKVIPHGDSHAWSVTQSSNGNWFSSALGNTTNQMTRIDTPQGGSVSDLYMVSPNVTPVLLGTFVMKTNGDLFFTAVQAIPEPSTYAAILGAATLAFAAYRRRRQVELFA